MDYGKSWSVVKREIEERLKTISESQKFCKILQVNKNRGWGQSVLVTSQSHFAALYTTTHPTNSHLHISKPRKTTDQLTFVCALTGKSGRLRQDRSVNQSKWHLVLWSGRVMSLRRTFNELVRTCTSLMEAIAIEISYPEQLCSNNLLLIMDLILSQQEKNNKRKQ